MPKRSPTAGQRQSVVKCCLNKHLLLPSLAPGIEELVDNVSRRVHRGSLLVNHFLLSRLSGCGIRDGVLSDQMLYYTAFSPTGSGSKYPDLTSFFREHAAKYEVVAPAAGTSASINAAAKAMKTNVLNSLFLLFDARLKKATQALTASEYRRDAYYREVNAVKQRIRGFKSIVPMVLRREQWEFIESSRAALGVDGNTIVSDAWIRRHSGRVVTLMFSFLRVLENAGLPGFALLPQAHQSRRFVTIDSCTLRHLMVKADVLRASVSQRAFTAIQADQFRSVFRYRGPWTVGTEVKTDGVSLCLNVWRDSHDTPAAQEPFSVPPGEEYLAVDPGRTNICSVVRVRDGEVLGKLRLTRKQYYNDGHLDTNRARRERLNAPLAEAYASLSEHDKKTSCWESFGSYLNAKRPHDARIWSVALSRRCARIKMDSYIHTRATLDRFWNRATRGMRRPVIAYGDARFASSGRGERSVPTARVKAAASRLGRVVEVDEYRTTMCCNACGALTSKVTTGTGDERREVRGLRRCESNDCRSAPLKSRDYNAACNMACCLAPGGRPDYLKRPDYIVA